MVAWEFQIQRYPHNNTYHQPKFHQEKDFSNYDVNAVKDAIKKVKLKREPDWEKEVREISELVDPNLEHGEWIGSMVECVTKTIDWLYLEQTGICLRYGWNVLSTPSFCQCGKENDVDHTLSCKKGGYVALRHNRFRDLN